MTILASSNVGGHVTINYIATGSNSLVSCQGAGETIESMTLSQMKWSSTGGTWTIKRGTTTYAIVDGNGSWDFSADSIPFESPSDITGLVSATLSAGSGSIHIKLKKNGVAT